MKDNYIRDLELSLSLSGMDKDNIEKAIRCAIGCLDNYDMTQRVTSVTVRYEDTNERILKRYIACLRLDGKSEGTIRSYTYALKKFSETCRKPFNEVTTNEIRYYLSVLSEGRKKSYIKIQRYYLSGFYKWMKNEEMITKNPCDRINDIKCEEEIRLPFSTIEIDKLRSSITGRYVIRNRAIMETLLSSGIRCAELCDIERQDIDLMARMIVIRKGKGGKGRKVYISEIAAEYIQRYLAKRKDDDPILFRSERGKFAVNGIEKMLMRHGETAKIDNVHPHRFRRTFATGMYKRGMDLEEIRRLMGHSDIKTTLKYIYTDDTQVRAAYEKYVA